MDKIVNLILLITICFIMLISHVRANYLISNGYDGGEELNKAIVRDIAVVIIYLFIKYIIINL